MAPHDYPPSSSDGPSREAAASMARGAPALRERVHAWLVKRGAGGATDEEMQKALGLKPQTQTPRRWELEKAGRVRKTTRTRQTESGRHATVWVASTPTAQRPRRAQRRQPRADVPERYRCLHCGRCFQPWHRRLEPPANTAVHACCSVPVCRDKHKAYLRQLGALTENHNKENRND